MKYRWFQGAKGIDNAKAAKVAKAQVEVFP
jgi:hypothetical protein